MSPEIYSVEQVAALLGLHVKTVRNYVREGRLKAVRIGKQYRIAREDLAAVTGTSLEPAPDVRARHIEVSSIVEIDAVSSEEARRLTNAVTSASRARPEGDAPLHVETIYHAERRRLKVILSGSIETVTGLQQALAFYLRN
jgi:excisionase family DNA binding protein